MYFDYLSTTPLDERVYEAMSPYWRYKFGNPHSADHTYGQEAADAVKNAQRQLDQLLPDNILSGEWIFTSGATESNNLALKSVANENQPRKTILVSAIEHPCVLAAAASLEALGFEVKHLHVTNDGVLDLEELERQINENVLCVSVMWANNETGVIQPIPEISELCAKHGVIFHTDAAQAAGKIPLSTDSSLFPDLISISGHKVYGPKGVGALWIKKGLEKRMTPLIHGGGQQHNLRSGTVPVPLVAALGKAIEVSFEDMEGECKRLQTLRDFFEDHMRAAFPDMHINGANAPRLTHVSHIQIPHVDAGDLLSALPEIAVSRGSACSSESTEDVSHVLAAMRMEFFAHECLRISFGRPTSEEDVYTLTNLLIETATMLRN